MEKLKVIAGLVALLVIGVLGAFGEYWLRKSAVRDVISRGGRIELHPSKIEYVERDDGNSKVFMKDTVVRGGDVDSIRQGGE